MSATDESATPLLKTHRVTAGYGAASRPVLRDISVAVAPGRTLGVVGESGSGKSTLARVLAGQLAPSRGAVQFDGREVAGLSRRDQRAMRRQIQLVPQDPYSSLDPRMTVEQTLSEAIDPRGRLRPRAHRARIAELLSAVALDPLSAARLPHEFSGGQRQRIAIARALAVGPRVIIADEITSALDVSVQAEVLELLAELQNRLGVAYVFITHDLAIAQYVCTELVVLYLGTVVEHGTTDVLDTPDHPYSLLLRDSIPDPNGLRDGGLPAELLVEADDPAHPPPGCVFHPRCPFGPRVRQDRAQCETELPKLVVSANYADRRTACHFPLGMTT